MTYLYIVFAVLGLYAECSKRINTKNILKKIGFGIIILGCLVQLSGHPNELIEIGAFSYIAADIWRKFKNG